MRALVLLGALWLVVQAPAAAQTGRCSAEATSVWRAGDLSLTIEAFSRGPRCAQAVTTLVIRKPGGDVAYTDLFQNDRNFALQDALNVAGLRAAPRAWVAPPDAKRSTTDSLPVWRDGEDLPALGEFAFYPEGAFASREEWEALRKRRAPMFCFVQGMESEACLVYFRATGTVEKIGAQSFPG